MARLKVSDEEKKNRIVRAAISGGQEREGYTDADMAKCLGVSVATYRAKKQAPGKFTLDDLQTIGRLLRFTPFQWAAIGMGRELTAKEIKDFILL